MVATKQVDGRTTQTNQLVEMRDGHRERFEVRDIIRIPLWDATILEGTISCPREWAPTKRVMQLEGHDWDRWYAE